MNISKNALLRIRTALLGGMKIGGLRLLPQRPTGLSAYVDRKVCSYTLMGRGWTLYFVVFDNNGISGVNLIGDRQKFEEDYILASLAA